MSIVTEFSEMPDEKISINRIVRRADISRGSFYQYFDDKVDLIEVLMKTFVEQTVEGVRRAAEESDGDIFYTYERLFELIAEHADNDVNKAVLRRLVRNIHANNDLVTEYMSHRFCGISDFKNCAKHFSRERFRFQNDEDFELIMQMLTGILKNSLFNYFVVGEKYEVVLSNFRRKIEILKAGVLLP